MMGSFGAMPDQFYLVTVAQTLKVSSGPLAASTP
jgi:hypothetical protein